MALKRVLLSRLPIQYTHIPVVPALSEKNIMEAVVESVLAEVLVIVVEEDLRKICHIISMIKSQSIEL